MLVMMTVVVLMKMVEITAVVVVMLVVVVMHFCYMPGKLELDNQSFFFLGGILRKYRIQQEV